ncbi:MAG TPA: FkbM family methyltransferase [Candidatus Polarisedimenticolaceae bacterium]|nr:FkbM family methyltransferase [Candidatus Polarisedimenticolaceae bacterium]
MDAPLVILRAITTRLPRIRGAGIVGNWARDFYARRPRPRVVADVLGLRMTLDPMENVDGSLLFFPHLYDHREIAALLDALPKDGVFVDVGAHIGFYALQAARRIGAGGRVVAIEADPKTATHLAENVGLNPGLPVTVVAVAVSDEEGTARLGLNTAGNRGGNSLLATGSRAIDVPCRPLAAILADAGLTHVDGMKLDVEGMEFRVLRRFLADATEAMKPRIVVLEHQSHFVDAGGGDANALLESAGYRCALRTSINRVLVRP